MNRTKKLAIAAVLLIIFLPIAAVALFVLTFNPNAYAPDIAAALANATGRQLTFGSPIKMALSFTPAIEADNVTLSNPPGFPDQNFLTLQKLQAQVALIPLLSHHIDIRHLVLIGPIVTLETTQTGQKDWNFTPAFSSNPATPPSNQPTQANTGQNYKIALQSVEVQNGQMIVKNAKGQQIGAVTLSNLTGAATSISSPLTIAAQASYNNAPFTLTGQLGPIERFSGIGTGPWPIDLSFSTINATVTINGTFTNPAKASGYNLALTANIPSLESFQTWLPTTITIPPIHNLTAAAQLTDQNSSMPAITALSIKAGASDLSSFRPGLTEQTIDIEMPSLTQPLKINIAGTLDNTPLSLTGTAGAIATLINPTWLPPNPNPANPEATPPIYPINLQAQAANAQITLTGGLATPNNIAGAAISLTATIPNLSALSPLSPSRLPAWKNISLQTTITDPGGLGLAKSIGITSLTLSMDNAALGGDASLYFGPHPRLETNLKSQSINLDALIAAIPPSPQLIPTTATAAPTTVTKDFTQSTTPLPIHLLQTASADIQLSADKLTINKTTYTALQTHAVLNNGTLTIAPLTAILPGGSITANATFNATTSPATTNIAITAPALALGPFLRTIDLPSDAQGTLQAQLTATGTGNTPHDFFSTTSGQLGLASVNGTINGSVLSSLFGPILNTIDLPETLIDGQGPVTMRCFALRMDATNGVGTIRALTLDTSRLTIQGGGTVSFGDEMLNLILRPQLQIVGADVGVPVQITGGFDNPKTGVAPMSALQAAGKSALGLPVTIVQTAANTNSFLGKVVSTLGLGGPGVTGAKPDICPAALSLARMGAPGPAPQAASTNSKTNSTHSSGPQNLLNSLFGK